MIVEPVPIFILGAGLTGLIMAGLMVGYERQVVMFNHHHGPSRHPIFDYLHPHHVHSCGRRGYGGMENARLDGKAAAETTDKRGA